MKPLAKKLLAELGGLAGVLAASEPELMRVEALDATGRKLRAGAQTALDLRLLHEATKRIHLGEAKQREVISSWTALLAYVRVALANAPREQFRVLFLDRRNGLIADEVMNQGTVDHAPVYPREIMRRALELSSSAVILVHNHPSGDPTPSKADIQMTRQVVEAGRPLNVQVHDHLIVGRDGVASFKALGLF